jgi:uncharacterized membrane protein YeaQ/YmgE (transglycosylase-associated protein family)
MSIIVWILFGALVGWIASIIAGTDEEQGAVMNIVVGIIGAFIGGLVAQMLGQSSITGFNLYSLLIAVIGSVILLSAYKAMARHH